MERDLAGILTGPIDSRLAAPHRLPFLPMRTPPLTPSEAHAYVAAS